MTEDQSKLTQDNTDGIPEQGPEGKAGGPSAAPSTPPTEEPAEARQIAERLAEQLAEQLKDQLLRKAAEFENYKRRTEGEYASLIRNANENLILALLPILDDFDRSIKAAKEGTDPALLLQGIELIQSKLVKTLENQGLAPFASAGKPFDVHYHDALLQIPRADLPPHTVIEEVERGYMLNDRILRHAKVIVSTDGGTDGGATGATTTEEANG